MEGPEVFTVLFLNKKRKRIKINCRCGHDFIKEVPEFMDRLGEMQVIHFCPECEQPYGSAMGKVARLDRRTMLPVAMAEQRTTPSESDVEDKLRSQGKVIQSESKAVN